MVGELVPWELEGSMCICGKSLGWGCVGDGAAGGEWGHGVKCG